ncbi:hypothetical protein MLD38_029326 [Melastoma candidum]|uniref:Uncharacterized protein n=1 Tax=Melastoma candidum TaxID=119954 RepID=A0ACB9N3R9_9MYRT|nr:hypothetical protein MLD38_029326 [Melastoma candidum]
MSWQLRFHGIIVPHDSCGNPINSESVKIDQSRPPEIDLVKQLAEQATKNVMMCNHRELKRRINDKKLLMRTKLSRVHEHNEAMLGFYFNISWHRCPACPDISMSERLSSLAIRRHSCPCRARRK